MTSFRLNYRRRLARWRTVMIAATTIASPAIAHEIVAGDLMIVHPYTIEPDAEQAARVPVFMVIRNRGGIADRLVAARSTLAASGALARRGDAEPNDVVTTGVDLPAHSEITLGPNGTYVLLRGLTESLAGYQYFPATLVFEKAGPVEIEIYVEDAAEAAATFSPSTQANPKEKPHAP